MTALIRSPAELVSAVNDLDVMNDPEFARCKILGDPSEGQPPYALWNAQQWAVIAVTRCSGYLRLILLRLGLRVPILTANRYAEWFPGDSAKALGWRSVDYAGAVDRANAGYPVVVCGVELPHGHVALAVPSRGNDPMTLYVTAAGSFNCAQMRFVDQFGGLAPKCRFYTHD